MINFWQWKPRYPSTISLYCVFVLWQVASGNLPLATMTLNPFSRNELAFAHPLDDPAIPWSIVNH
jgi:hypothetical protein